MPNQGRPRFSSPLLGLSVRKCDSDHNLSLVFLAFVMVITDILWIYLENTCTGIDQKLKHGDRTMINEMKMNEMDQVDGGHGFHIRRGGTTDHYTESGDNVFTGNYWHIFTEHPSQKLKPVMDGRPLPYNGKYSKAGVFGGDPYLVDPLA